MLCRWLVLVAYPQLWSSVTRYSGPLCSFPIASLVVCMVLLFCVLVQLLDWKQCSAIKWSRAAVLFMVSHTSDRFKLRHFQKIYLPKTDPAAVFGFMYLSLIEPSAFYIQTLGIAYGLSAYFTHLSYIHTGCFFSQPPPTTNRLLCLGSTETGNF